MTELSLDTWLVSDTHFGHANIVRYCRRPINHNKIMMDNWCKVIMPDDDVLHLGDLAIWYGIQEQYWLNKAKDLPGKKKMIRGNHDLLSRGQYSKLGYRIVAPFRQEINGVVYYFTHDYCWKNNRTTWKINIHGHVHNHKSHRWSHYHINVSMEVMDYKPIRLRELIGA